MRLLLRLILLFVAASLVATVMFPPDALRNRYGTEDAYLDQVADALDDAIDQGFVLAADRSVALAEAEEFDFG